MIEFALIRSNLALFGIKKNVDDELKHVNNSFAHKTNDAHSDRLILEESARLSH